MSAENRVVRLDELTANQRGLVLALIEADRKGEKQMAVAELVRESESEAPPSIQASLVTVTPKLAEGYLGANTHNRHLRPTVVDRYARDMAAGNWDLNGETIKIAASGLILDGQHRLVAITRAGVSLPMFVVSGLPESAQDTVDRGMPRNSADALRLRGETQVTVLAGAIHQAIVMQSGSPSDHSAAWPSTKEVLRYLEEHPDIRASVLVGEQLRKAVVYPSTTAAALHHLFAQTDAEDADTFFTLLAAGADLPDTSPILRLREMMVREISAQRRMQRYRLQALTIKAWNAWRRGDEMRLLTWKTGGSKPEAFPRPE